MDRHLPVALGQLRRDPGTGRLVKVVGISLPVFHQPTDAEVCDIATLRVDRVKIARLERWEVVSADLRVGEDTP